ncbi:TlpA family protein disulfide reductase [Myxococcota bacterium]|nr:TlpA family protein disulfide reductase [Myxococcota bacterium]
MGAVRAGVKGAIRRVAQAVARRVAQDDLFEKPGERAPTPPLPPRPAAPAPPPAAAAPRPSTPPPSSPPPSSPPGAPGLEVRGCERADLDRVSRAHGPGPRPRVVNHWATWCVPCVDELPLLVDLARQLEGKADFLGVSWDLFDPRGDEDDIVEHVARFADGHGVPWGSLLVTAPPKDFFKKLALPSQKVPQTWVIGADGAVLARFDGALDAAQAHRIRELLGGEAG